MASTRNNNTTSDYKLQQHQFDRMRDYAITPADHTIINGAYPKFGINVQKMPNSQLANNSVDIESALYGIGSTNLVRPKEPVMPRLKDLNEVTFINRLELFVPRFEDLNSQRPLFR